MVVHKVVTFHHWWKWITTTHADYRAGKQRSQGCGMGSALTWIGKMRLWRTSEVSIDDLSSNCTSWTREQEGNEIRWRPPKLTLEIEKSMRDKYSHQTCHLSQELRIILLGQHWEPLMCLKIDRKRRSIRLLHTPDAMRQWKARMGFMSLDWRCIWHTSCEAQNKIKEKGMSKLLWSPSAVSPYYRDISEFARNSKGMNKPPYGRSSSGADDPSAASHGLFAATAMPDTDGRSFYWVLIAY